MIHLEFYQHTEQTKSVVLILYDIIIALVVGVIKLFTIDVSTYWFCVMCKPGLKCFLVSTARFGTLEWNF